MQSPNHQQGTSSDTNEMRSGIMHTHRNGLSRRTGTLPASTHLWQTRPSYPQSGGLSSTTWPQRNSQGTPLQDSPKACLLNPILIGHALFVQRSPHLVLRNESETHREAGSLRRPFLQTTTLSSTVQVEKGAMRTSNSRAKVLEDNCSPNDTPLVHVPLFHHNSLNAETPLPSVLVARERQGRGFNVGHSVKVNSLRSLSRRSAFSATKWTLAHIILRM